MASREWAARPVPAQLVVACWLRRLAWGLASGLALAEWLPLSQGRAPASNPRWAAPAEAVLQRQLLGDGPLASPRSGDLRLPRQGRRDPRTPQGRNEGIEHATEEPVDRRQAWRRACRMLRRASQVRRLESRAAEKQKARSLAPVRQRRPPSASRHSCSCRAGRAACPPSADRAPQARIDRRTQSYPPMRSSADRPRFEPGVA